MTIRFTIGGRLAGAQRWSISFGMVQASPGAVPSATQLSTLADQLFDDFVSQVWKPSTGGTSNQLAAYMGDRSNLDQVRTYHAATPASPADVVGISSRSTNAGSGTATFPPQVALAVTLNTGLAGRSNRGRVYIPMGPPTGTDGSVSTAYSVTAATWIANFLSLANTHSLAGGALSAAVVSATTGASQPITSCSADNVLDTQRRRRDKIVPAARTNVVVTAP